MLGATMGGRHSNKPSLHDVRQHAAGDQGRPGRISFFKQTQRMTTPPLEASGGARRDRTDDLLLAKQALSQLSYGPGWVGRWWARVELNYRPHAYQACALTT